MRVALVLVIIKETGQLCAAARHTITFSFPDAHFTAEPTFACPHQDLLSLVPENQAAEDPHMHQTLISSKPHQDILSFVPGKLVSKACVACPTLITKYALSEDKNLAAFWVVRNLGSCKWPVDRPWFDQCRLTGTFFSHNDIYWLRSRNLQKMMQGVYGQWKRDYCLEQKRRLLQHQSESSRTTGDETLASIPTATLLFLASSC
ncbi:hypothetical protein N7516_000818 [Penicillium verrucosum]|uniref:uncharacterized protein n=1 Tax=Penicillium verrucosum TaxID=60171 RepID=UPI0025450E87|nr:uncharacterized protein N7516_000818 [Penicillium verrucosum]KAJ5940650.1 hypothetical protein N7516_000818 [Penicillium verrucosum]